MGYLFALLGVALFILQSIKLKALPDYIKVKAAVSFSENLTMEQLINLKGNSKAAFLWAGIRNAPEDVQRLPLCGIDINGSGIVYQQIDNKYPAFELALCSNDGNYSTSDYETHFKSILQYSIDHTDFLNALDHHMDYVSYYQSVLDYVTDNGVKTYGVLVDGSAKDILTLMDNGVVSQIWPLDANIGF